MVRLILVLLLAWVAAVPAWASPGPVLVLGDSLSAAYGIDREQGWVALLEERLQDRQPPLGAVNAAISGDTTRGGLARLPDLLERHRPSVLVVELGGNDGLRGIAPTEMQANLERMVSLARDAGARVLLAGVRLPPNYGPAFTRLFARAFAGAAESTNAAFVPRILDGVAERPDLMQDDGIHPTAEAQPIILDNVWPKLVPLLPEATAASEAG